jgi:hypothetical protein
MAVAMVLRDRWGSDATIWYGKAMPTAVLLSGKKWTAGLLLTKAKATIM